MMNTMMQQTLISGTARKAEIPGWQAAGKTGTSQDFRDAWFIGYTANLVTGVWLGNDDNSPTKKATGGGLPVEVWTRFMRAAHQGVPVAALPNSQYGGACRRSRRSPRRSPRRHRLRRCRPVRLGGRSRAPGAARTRGGARWLADGRLFGRERGSALTTAPHFRRHTPRKRGNPVRRGISAHPQCLWNTGSPCQAAMTAALNPRSRSGADRCHRYRATSWRARPRDRSAPTTRQNRAEWFISTRCATSWAAR